MNTDRYKIVTAEITKSKYTGRTAVYPWGTLPVTSGDVGKAFFVPNGKIASFRAMAARQGKKHHVKFVARAVKIDGVPGVCVWRVK